MNAVWQPRLLMFAELLDGSALYQQQEAQTLGAWLHAVDTLQPLLARARMVKRGSDKLLVCHDDAEALLSLVDDWRCAMRGRSLAPVRIGLHQAMVVEEDYDLLGSGVNLAARLAGLAGAWGCVLSSEVRQQLSPHWQSRCADLGRTYLKHWPEPVQAWLMT